MEPPDGSSPGEVCEYFFRYTSQRWIFDEPGRLAERYVRFDVAALMRIAATSVRRHHCVSIVKLDEGYSNKAFLLTMDDGYEVIARIPMLKAGVPRLTTASEAATMDFLRNHMGIPVPQVFAWNCRRDGGNVCWCRVHGDGEDSGTHSCGSLAIAFLGRNQRSHATSRQVRESKASRVDFRSMEACTTRNT